MNKLDQLFGEYILECEYAAKLRPETIRGYKHVFGLFVRIMPAITLEMLSSTVMMEFFKKLQTRERLVGKTFVNTGIKTSTAATYRKKLNHFFKWLKTNKHIAENPFDNMPYVAPVYGDQKWIRKDNIDKIIAAIVNANYTNIFLLKRNLLMFYILLFCGIRRGELLGLQLRDIDLKRKEFTVRPETSKSKRARIVPMNHKVMMQLNDYLEERGKRKLTTPYLLVSGHLDHKFTDDGLNHLVGILVKRSGVKFTPHCFRHTFAVNFLNLHRDIAKLKQLLGHTSITTTEKYLRCLPTNEMRRDLEIMDVDNML